MKRSWHRWLFLLLIPVLWLLSPAGVNGDGIGYLNQVGSPGLAPGHPGYLPLIRFVAGLVPHQTLLELAPALRLLSICCAVVALGLFFDTCLIATHLRGATLATALLGGSHAFFRSATEIEAYAPAALCVVATLWALTNLRERQRLSWAVLAGVFAGLGVSLHLTLALLALPISATLLRSRRGWRQTLLALGAMALVSAVVLGLAFGHQGLGDPEAAWRWLTNADHGMPYRHDLMTPLKGLWGLCRALIHAPYPYEASMARVALLSGLGAAGWVVLLRLRWRPVIPLTWRPASMDHLTLLAWLAPFGAFALYFYPSDSERWLFVLPAILLYLAPGLGGPPPRRGGGWPRLRGPSVTVAGLVLVCNVAVYQLPAAMDTDAVHRAAVVDRLVTKQDLVVSPGHGWDELIGLSVHRPARRYSLVYHAGTSGLGPAVTRMYRQIRATWRSGGKVYAARLRDRRDRRGYKELEWFGLEEEDFLELFSRYQVAPTAMVGLWELAPKK